MIQLSICHAFISALFSFCELSVHILHPFFISGCCCVFCHFAGVHCKLNTEVLRKKLSWSVFSYHTMRICFRWINDLNVNTKIKQHCSEKRLKFNFWTDKNTYLNISFDFIKIFKFLYIKELFIYSNKN